MLVNFSLYGSRRKIAVAVDNLKDSIIFARQLITNLTSFDVPANCFISIQSNNSSCDWKFLDVFSARREPSVYSSELCKSRGFIEEAILEDHQWSLLSGWPILLSFEINLSANKYWSSYQFTLLLKMCMFDWIYLNYRLYIFYILRVV